MLKNPDILKTFITAEYKRANRKQVLLAAWGVDRIETLVKQKYAIDEQIGIWKEEYRNAVKDLKDCGARKDLATAYLSKANVLRQQFNGNWMSFQKQVINSSAGLSLYANSDRSNYLLAIAKMKHDFLSNLAGLQCEFEVGCLMTDPPPTGRGALPDFDSLTCQYSDEIFIPPFTTIKTRCNQMSVEFDIDTEFGLKVQVGWEENLNFRYIWGRSPHIYLKFRNFHLWLSRYNYFSFRLSFSITGRQHKDSHSDFAGVSIVFIRVSFFRLE